MVGGGGERGEKKREENLTKPYFFTLNLRGPNRVR